MTKFTVLNLAIFNADFLGNFGESLLALGKEIKLQGGRLVVCFPERKSWAISFENEEIGIKILPIKKTLDFKAIRLIYKIVKKYDVSIIHTHFGLECR